MKTLLSYSLFASLCTAFAVGLPAQSSDDAVLLRMDGDLQQVRVEAYDTEVSRWVAIASGYRDAVDTGWLKIALPEGYDQATLRVMGNPKASPFAGKVSSSAVPDSTYVDYPPSLRNYATVDGAEGGGSSEPVIEEADIWAWEDSTLYFYNQYRGLQVMDMSDPTEPAWLDYFRYPAKGEDLYSTGNGRVILIGTGYYWRGEKLSLQFLDFDGTSVSLTDTVELPAGYYMDSRRYNDHLYVMTREWVEEVNPDNQRIYAPRIHLYTVALNDDVEDRIVDEKVFDGDGWLDAVLTAQPDGILLCLNKWYNNFAERRYRWRSEVHVLVPGEDGIPYEAGVAGLSGILRDKYKLSYKDGVLTTISQPADWSSGQFSRITKLENFRLGDSGFVRVGSLEMAPNETVFATRFLGDTVYIVTFLFVDPLFAIDNSNPADPVIAGELEVPGWSNYIEWVDNFLFAIGMEDSKLTVSTFDVSDPANMSLASRVFLSEDSWAYSEAQYDDQAISFYEDANLLMLPFTTYSWKSPYEMIQAMQLVTWDDVGKLSLRGQIQHLDVPRRGELKGDTVITISGREVVTTDVSDPDTPFELGQETLAWNVQHLIPHDEYWLQLESVNNNYGYYIWRYPYSIESQTEPVLYVTSRSEPNIPEVEVPLEKGIVLGVFHRGDYLVLLQDTSEIPENTDYYWNPPEKQSIAVRVYDLTDPLAPVLTGEDSLENVEYLGNNFAGEGAGDSSILFRSDADPFYGWYYLDVAFAPWYFQSSLSYLVCQVDGAGVPTIVARDVFPTEDYWNQASRWFWEPPLLVSSMTNYVEHQKPDVAYPNYEARTHLVAVDFTEPAKPVLLPRAKLPGGIVAIDTLPDGENYYLYFEPEYNVLSVWGWDKATAFPLFRQKLENIENGSSYSLNWMAPFNLRNRYYYNETNNRYTMEVWYHDTEASQFRRTARFQLDNNWIYSNAVQEPYFLMTTSDQFHLFKGSAESGEFVRLRQENLPFPNIYGQQLDQAVLTNESVFIPAGMYGVDGIEFSPALEPPDAVVYPAAAEAGDAWTEVSVSNWQRTARGQADEAGIMDRMQWLYRADSLVEPDPQATDAGDLWRNSAWFGYYANYSDKPAWVFHLEHGPMWVHTMENEELDGLFLFGAGLGAAWTRPDLYPFIYSFAKKGWVFYVEDTGLDGKRWFYDFQEGWFGF